MSKTNCPKCNKPIESKFNDKEKLHYFFCDNCKLGGKSKTEKEAEKIFLSQHSQHSNLPIIKTLPDKDTFIIWTESNLPALQSEYSAKFIDKPETIRMIRKNARYIQNADFKKVWETPEGKESIVAAFEESLYMAATLPEMGSIVPFGKTVEFIPAVSAFEFALTSGKSAPFCEIQIHCIYDKDIYEISSTNGNFNFELKKVGFPRGEIIGVVVQAKTTNGKIIGEAYDEARLMKKAEQHSVSYKYYLQDMHALKKAQSEGKDHIIKWEKKIYEHDITNPYANADKPEMLKKLAGKSFLWPYMKIRNAGAMVSEWKESDTTQGDNNISEKQAEKIIVESINAVKQDIKDADFVIEDEKTDRGLFTDEL